MKPPPIGTVTFLFTDIEGSTKLWQQHPEAMNEALNRHHALLSESIAAHGGYVFQIIGDAFCAAFSTANTGLEAALDAQRALAAEKWGTTGAILVRMALHTGKAEVQVGEYTSGEYVSGLTLSRTARLLSAGHGGQILLSLPTAELARDHLPPDTALRDLGAGRLKDLIHPEHIFQVVAPGLPADFAPLKTLDVHPHNLPVQLTSFIGREREMDEIKKLLARAHLLTLTGIGGAGKTRLALQCTADLIDDYPGGVWLVELAPLRDPALVAQTVASVMGVREGPGGALSDLLGSYVQGKHLLLILDNCEHVVEACAQLADLLLRRAPGLKILATSRVHLNLAGEMIYPVPPLALPVSGKAAQPPVLAQYEAVRLFVERATPVHPTFRMTEANAPSVAQICTRLDGIPLAIELAAARISVLSPEQIAARLSDRFNLLTGGSRNAMPRQQTLRALIDWSWDLLSARERDVLGRLSVFAGGWILEEAEHVCAGEELESGKILDLLAQLVNQSLVAVESEQGPETRYNLLETIHQYAGEKLVEIGNLPTCRDQHMHYFSGLAEQAEVELHRRDQKLWLDRLETEHDNFRAALEYSIDARPEEALRICTGLIEFWDIRGYISEGRKWIKLALEAAQDLPPTPNYVKMLYGAGWAAARQTDVEQYQMFQEKGLEMARQINDLRGIAIGLQGLGLLKERFQGKPEQVDSLYADSLRLWCELGDTLGIGQALGPLAERSLGRQDYPEAERLFNESLAHFRQLGDLREIAGALCNLAEVALAQANNSRAETLASESLALYRELEDKHGIATALRTLGKATFPQAGKTQLEAIFEESCSLFRELNDRGCLAFTLATGGREILAMGDLQNGQRMV
jgi:predicted ATPase/class 3 adenylate cyclase